MSNLNRRRFLAGVVGAALLAADQATANRQLIPSRAMPKSPSLAKEMRVHAWTLPDLRAVRPFRPGYHGNVIRLYTDLATGALELMRIMTPTSNGRASIWYHGPEPVFCVSMATLKTMRWEDMREHGSYLHVCLDDRRRLEEVSMFTFMGFAPETLGQAYPPQAIVGDTSRLMYPLPEVPLVS